MKGKNCFTRKEADQIRELLDKKCIATTEEQKAYRRVLRRTLVFYISDFTGSKAGFTSADFDMLVENKQVSIIY